MERIAWFLPSRGEKSHLILLWRFDRTFVVTTHFLFFKYKGFSLWMETQIQVRRFCYTPLYLSSELLWIRAERFERILLFWFCAFFSAMASKTVLDWDSVCWELLCVALITGRAHKKRMKDGTSFFGLGPLKVGLDRCWSKIASALLFFLHYINHSGLPVVGNIQCYQIEALSPG